MPAPGQAGHSPDFAVPMVSAALMHFGSADHSMLVADSIQPIPYLANLPK
jgi:hypothetical protein